MSLLSSISPLLLVPLLPLLSSISPLLTFIFFHFILCLPYLLWAVWLLHPCVSRSAGSWNSWPHISNFLLDCTSKVPQHLMSLVYKMLRVASLCSSGKELNAGGHWGESHKIIPQKTFNNWLILTTLLIECVLMGLPATVVYHLLLWGACYLPVHQLKGMIGSDAESYNYTCVARQEHDCMDCALDPIVPLPRHLSRGAP